MHIAICLSGYARTFEDCFEKTINNIMSSNPNCKFSVYALFWDSTFGRVDKINDPWHSKSSTVLQNSPTFDYIKSVIEKSKVDNYAIEFLDHKINETMMERGKSVNFNPPGLLSQYFSTNMVWELSKDSNADFYVRLRPDVILNSFPDLSKFNNCVILNKYYWYNDIAGRGSENEMFWVSHKSCAEKSFSLYERLVTNSFPFGCQLHGESITGRHFATINCPIERYDFQYRVVR